MAVPTRSTFHRPILEIARDAEDGARLSTAQFLGELTDRLSLTEADLQERLDSGASRVKNHIGRALSSLTRAGLLDRPSPGQYQITEKGLSFIHGREGRIGHSLLIRMIAERQQYQPGDTGVSPEGGPIARVSENGDDTAPDEKMEASYRALRNYLKMARRHCRRNQSSAHASCSTPR